FYIGQAAGLVVTLPLGALKLVDTRYRYSKSLQIVDEAALDRYIFVRDAYLQHRNYLIYDGHPPQPKYEDEGDGEAPAETPKSKDEGNVEPDQTPKSKEDKIQEPGQSSL
ncbi:MAG: MlaA family lipoprotein, partial [Burkholderiales bacterium]